MRCLNPLGRILTAVVSISFIGFLTQCASLSRAVITEPRIQMEGVAVTEVNSQGAKLVFSIRVENPNRFRLKVDSVRYDVEINGKTISHGQIDEPTEVPSNAHSVVEIPLPVLYRDLFDSIANLFRTRSSRYHLKGEARFGVLSVPIDASGEIKI